LRAQEHDREALPVELQPQLRAPRFASQLELLPPASRQAEWIWHRRAPAPLLASCCFRFDAATPWPWLKQQ
jgi:hypothetical protein